MKRRWFGGRLWVYRVGVMMVRLISLMMMAMGPALLFAEKPPNIVFILADDLGIMDLGAFAVRLGGADPAGLYYETPHMDSLAGRGIAFSQAYANQLCSPTRAALLTGRIASRIGVTTATPLTATYYNQGRPVPEGYSPHDAYQHKDRIGRELAWHNGAETWGCGRFAPLPAEPTCPPKLQRRRKPWRRLDPGLPCGRAVGA